jgi:hypothetical protein
MSRLFTPFSITGIGSLPHHSASDACELVLKTMDIPFWPQLPQVSFRESMIPQYAEGMPFLRINAEDETVWVARDDSDQLERFYEACSDTARIAMSGDYAAGLHTFLKMIKGRRFPVIKGHVTGPLTFTLGLKDSDGRYIYFDEEFREIASMLLGAKVRWQVDMLKQHAERVVVFIDEPILSALGSSTYLGVDSGEALRLLRNTVAAVESAGAVPGIHCCGRADWPLVLESGVKILNFDAFAYFDSLLLYHEEVKSFLEGGGYLAWGIVPTSDAIASVDDGMLAALMRGKLEKMCAHIPSGLVMSQILLTPSCGTGSRSVEETTRIFQLLIRLKEAMA